MRAHRGKQFDWSKPLKLVETKSAFEQLDSDAVDPATTTTTKAEANGNTINKKEEIIVPKIEEVRRIT
jgi:hypothetical protein